MDTFSFFRDKGEAEDMGGVRRGYCPRTPLGPAELQRGRKEGQNELSMCPELRELPSVVFDSPAPFLLNNFSFDLKKKKGYKIFGAEFLYSVCPLTFLEHILPSCIRSKHLVIRRGWWEPRLGVGPRRGAAWSTEDEGAFESQVGSFRTRQVSSVPGAPR